jgi:exosome complex component RRP42
MQAKYAAEMINKGTRIDGRNLLDYRSIEVKTGVINKAEGSAHVRMGDTQVIAGVKMAIGTPFPDAPDEGVLMCSAEFTPLASPDFEAGPPSPESVELARVVDRGIRESHMIELEKLKIDDTHVWNVFVDIHIISHDGNLMDAASLASVAALKTTKIPKIDMEKMSVILGEREGSLPVAHTPINVTVCKVGDKMLIDPTRLEEDVVDAKLCVASREDGKICALQKQGSVGIKVSEIPDMIDLAVEKSEYLRKLVE